MPKTIMHFAKQILQHIIHFNHLELDAWWHCLHYLRLADFH